MPAPVRQPAEDFPLAEPTKEDVLQQHGVTGQETIAERTTRNISERAAVEQSRQLAATQGDRFEAARAAQAEQQRALEEQYGQYGTIGTHTAKGIFNAVLSLPALAGEGLETVGELTDSDLLREFGRDVGRASTGENALGSIGAAQAQIFGQDAHSGYAAAMAHIANTAKAWPLTASTSSGVGAILGTVATAGLGGEAEGLTLGQKMLSAGAQGAGFGAQQGYAQDAPLQDILSASLIGGALGAGTAGVIGKGQEWLASPAAQEAFEDIANSRAIKALGARASDITKMRSGGLTGEEAAKAIGKGVLDFKLANGEGIFPETVGRALTMGKEELAERITQGAAEVGEKLGGIRAAAVGITEKTPSLLPKAEDVAGRIKSEVLESLGKSALNKGKIGAIETVLTDIEKGTTEEGKLSLSQLLETRKALDSKIWPEPAGGGLTRIAPEGLKELVATRGIIDDAIDSTISAASKAEGAEGLAGYEGLKKTASSLIQARRTINPALDRDLGHRALSLSDMLAGSAEFAGEVSHGESGLLLGGLKGAAVAAAHKYIRQQGSTIAAVAARKLAQGAPELAEALEPAGISVAAAGGREAQNIINMFSGSRRAIANAVEDAGPNPDLRAVAQRDEADRQTQIMVAKAGDFKPADWQSTAPTAIQKVVFRGPILDAVSRDFASAVQTSRGLAPDTDLALNPDRLERLTRNADGSSAIGRLQVLAKQIIDNAPQTVFGDHLMALANQTRQQLATTDVPQSMLAGHELAGTLRSFASQARDQVTRDFALRQASAVHDALSSDDFGEAGQLYAKAYPDEPEQMKQLSDPDQVRNALRTTSAKGELQQHVEQFASQVRDAHDAREQLTGEKPDSLVAKGLDALTKLASKAENAVLLDGGPIGRIFDHLQGNAGSSVAKSDPGTLVLRTISDRMQRLLPMLADRGEEEPENQPPPKADLTVGDRQALYKERLNEVSQLVANPTGNSLADSLRGQPNIPPDLATLVATQSQDKLSRLLQDMPKPQENIRGKAFETLSSEDVRRGNAMWEATVKPLSLFDDFRSGAIDYDKVQYTWQQYPALQRAAQAGMLDLIHGHLTEDERASIPDRLLTQCDYLLGFNGSLQPSVTAEFSRQIDAMQAQLSAAPKARGASLKTPLSGGTFTEKIMQKG